MKRNIKLLLVTTALISSFSCELLASEKNLAHNPATVSKYGNFLAPGDQAKKPHAEKAQKKLSKEARVYDDGVKIHIKDIEIIGAEAGENKQVLDLVRHMLGASASSSAIEADAQKIRKFYQEQGFILAMAYVPKQSFANGLVKIQVTKGAVREVLLVGDEVKSPVFEKYVEKILEMQPVTKTALVRYLELMNKIPGYEVLYRFKPIKTPKGNKVADLEIDVKRTHGKVSGNVDNYGTKDLGRNQISLGSEFLSPFNKDETMFGFIGTSNKPNKLKSVTVGYEKIVGSCGTAVSLLGSFSTNTPNPPPGTDDSKKNNDSNMVRAAISNYPILTNKSSVLVEAGAQNFAQISYNGVTKQSKHHILTGFIGTQIEHHDRFDADNNLAVAAYKAINGASSVTMYDSTLKKYSDSFTLLTGNFWRDQPLFGPASLYIAANGQYSGAELPLNEKFAVGGMINGRGYKTALISSNKGGGANAEFRLSQYSNGIVNFLQPYLFYDVASFNKTQAKTNVASLASAGGGIRVGVTGDVFLNLEIGKPLRKEITIDGVTSKNNTRYSFTVNKEFKW